MNTANVNNSLVDSYYTLLKSLSPDNKLELIARLSKSLQSRTERKGAKKKEEDASLDALYGSWVSEESADELVEALKKARNFSRKREAL